MNNTDSHFDHNEPTHTASCDAKGCDYVAQVHAHEDEGAVMALSRELAFHNKSVHGVDTDPEDIKDEVREKLVRV